MGGYTAGKEVTWDDAQQIQEVTWSWRYKTGVLVYIGDIQPKKKTKVLATQHMQELS